MLPIATAVVPMALSNNNTHPEIAPESLQMALHYYYMLMFNSHYLVPSPIALAYEDDVVKDVVKEDVVEEDVVDVNNVSIDDIIGVLDLDHSSFSSDDTVKDFEPKKHRRFKCKWCKNTYERTDGVRKHARKKHGLKSSEKGPSSYCDMSYNVV